MIAIATIFKCLTRSNEQLDGDRENSARVSVAAMEEQCKEPRVKWLSNCMNSTILDWTVFF